MKTKAINTVCLILTIVVIYSLLFICKITCLVKYLFGVSCPCCGMSRAWLELLHMNIDKAFYFHPFFVFPVFIIIGLIAQRKYEKIGKAIIFISFVILIIVYIIRLFYGSTEIVEVNINKGVIYKMIENFK